MISDTLYRVCDFLNTSDLIKFKIVNRQYHDVLSKYLKNQRSLFNQWQKTHETMMRSNYKVSTKQLLYPIFLRDLGLLVECKLFDNVLTLRLESHLGCKRFLKRVVSCKSFFSMDNVDEWKVSVEKDETSYNLIIGDLKEAVVIDLTNLSQIEIKSYFYTKGLFSSCTRWKSTSSHSKHHEVYDRDDLLIFSNSHLRKTTIQKCIKILNFSSKKSFFWNLNNKNYFFSKTDGYFIVDMVNLKQHKIHLNASIKNDLANANCCYFWNPVEESLNIITHGVKKQYISVMRINKTWKVIYRSKDFVYKYGTFCPIAMNNVFFQDQNNDFLTQHQFWEICREKCLKSDEINVESWLNVDCVFLPTTYFHLKEIMTLKNTFKITDENLIIFRLELDDNNQLCLSTHKSLFDHTNYFVLKLQDLFNMPPLMTTKKLYLTSY